MMRHFMLAVIPLLLVAMPALSDTSAWNGDEGDGCTPTGQHGCTTFLAANQNITLAGNNEDWRNPLSKLWFIPATDGTFGQMYVGFDDYFPQGGMNEQGLFFDGLAVSQTLIPPQTELPDITKDALNTIMATCGNVQCVIDYINAYDRVLLTNAQLFFADASLHSAALSLQKHQLLHLLLPHAGCPQSTGDCQHASAHSRLRQRE